MTKNEQIASILLEAAELLKKDSEQDSLNEDVGLAILGSIAGLVTISSIYTKVSNALLKKKMFKNKHSIHDYRTSGLLLTNMTEIIKKAKYIKYKKSVKDVLITNTKIFNQLTDKIDKLDKELYSIKSKEEYYNKKERLEKEYNTIYENSIKALKSSLDKLKNDNEYIENDFSIVSIIEKYLDCGIYRNLDGDDYWEVIEFLYDMYINGEEGTDVDKIFSDAYSTLTAFPEYSVQDMKEYSEPLKYITIKVK